MPELPEVETVRRGLAPTLVGARILRVELRRRICGFPFPKDFAKKLRGRRIDSLNRRAKYLIAALDDGAALIAHLGMSGSFRIEASEDGQGEPSRNSLAPSPCRVQKTRRMTMSFFISSGARVIYNDPRRFGFMTLAAKAELAVHPFFADLGVEPLSNDFDAQDLGATFAGKKTALKSALLDQKLIAGLGNIYVCEALHRAGLSPDRPAGELVRPMAAPSPRRKLARADSRRCWRRRSKREARPCAIIGRPMGRWAISSIISVFTVATGEACSTPSCGGTIRQAGAERPFDLFLPEMPELNDGERIWPKKATGLKLC